MLTDLFSLKGKNVVITGGAGYLGATIVQGLLSFGAEVVIADVADKEPEDIVKDADLLPRLHYIKCDLSDTGSIRDMFKSAKNECGKINILINCATYGAGYGKAGKVEFMSDRDWNKGIDGSVGVTFRCTREVVSYLEESGGGCIVNFGSMYGVVSPDPGVYGESGQNNPANYGAGKAAVIQFTRYCAAHLAKKNIRVNSVTPGPFPNSHKLPPEDFLNSLKSKTMLGKVGEPKDIVGAVILLSSDASNFMTGSNIIVDGGWTAW